MSATPSAEEHEPHPAVCLARHGIAVPRGQGPLASARGGRFGRMFGHLPSRDAGPEAIEALARHMEELARASGLSPDPGSLPAGFTYLAQFVDHDITFDPMSKLQRDNDPGALANFRTPRFDLDSVYGAGPADQPFLYDWRCAPHPPGVKLLVGSDPPAPPEGDPPYAAVDLPRNAQGRALIGDARNDENLIVSQLHLLFIRFHNKVIDHLAARETWPPGFEILEEAQRLVRWHYQWIVVHDLLERIVRKDVLADVLRPSAAGAPPSVHRRYFTWQDEPVIPVEFSGAAYRFGHSMVRHRYKLRNEGQEGSAEVRDVSIFLEPDHAPEDRWKHLGGFRRRPEKLTISWGRFFELDPHEVPQRAQKLNQLLSVPLFALPPDDASLARLNLERGRALGLPAGADVAQAMGHPALDEGLLRIDVGEPARSKLLRATPLWFYLLREAATDGNSQRLGSVASRIVTEVLVGLLEGDPNSYMRQAPAWTPCLPREKKDDFTMADLVRFVEGTPPPKPSKPRTRRPG